MLAAPLDLAFNAMALQGFGNGLIFLCHEAPFNESGTLEVDPTAINPQGR